MTSPPRRTDAASQFAPVVFAVIAVGGAVGALARYGIGDLNPSATNSFPIGTFIANVAGAFGLGLLVAVLDHVTAPRLVKPLIATGFFGAFTTFSTFAVEIVQRLKDGYVAMAFTYAIVTLVVGLAAAKIGLDLGHRLRSTSRTEQ